VSTAHAHEPPSVEPLPPADTSAEQVLIGSCLISPQALADAAQVVDVGDFYRWQHAELFAAMLDIRAAGQPVDHITVNDHIGVSRMERLGGAPYLLTCSQAVPTATNAMYYAEIVAEKAVRRRLVEVGTRIAQLAYQSGDTPTADLLSAAREALGTVASGGRAGSGRQLQRTRASEVLMRRLRFLWEDRIVLGALTLLAGREGIGKSTVAVDIAAQVTRGRLAGELHGQPRTVIYVNTEDARDLTIVPRLAAAGADLDRVVFVNAVTRDQESPLVLPLDTARLEAEIADLDAALVVLDAATSAIDSSLDGDRDRQMRQGLEPIGQLAARTGCSFLGIVHFGKRESGDTGKLILGSIAWSQVARSVLAVARDDETGQLIVTATKANLAPGDVPSLAAQLASTTVHTEDGPTPVGRIEWLGETTRRAQELLASSVDPEERSRIDEATEWLREYFSDPDRGGAAGAKEVLRAAAADGFNERLMQRARKRAGVRTGKGKGGWTWSWEPSGEGDPDTQGDKGWPS
jgi:hypothetical protein